MIQTEVPALRYLVQMRIVEFQDWHTPPPSDDDDDFPGRRDCDSDSGDNNYNGYWPGFVESGGGGSCPRTTRYCGAGDPRLGRGPTFEPRQRRSTAVMVGLFSCPVQPVAPMPCSPVASRIPREGASREPVSVAGEADVGHPRCSPSPVKPLLADPMSDEACVNAPENWVQCASLEQLHSVDRDPRARRTSPSVPRKSSRRLLYDDFDKLAGRQLFRRPAIDGPPFLFEPSTSQAEDVVPRSPEDLYLSGPEDNLNSGPSSPRAQANKGPEIHLDTPALADGPPTPPRYSPLSYIR